MEEHTKYQMRIVTLVLVEQTDNENTSGRSVWMLFDRGALSDSSETLLSTSARTAADKTTRSLHKEVCVYIYPLRRY